MSLPQNNLEDLKRRVPVGHITCHAMPLPDGGQPKVRMFSRYSFGLHVEFVCLRAISSSRLQD